MNRRSAMLSMFAAITLSVPKASLRHNSIQQFDEIVATFRPMRSDDLKPGVAQHIGHTDTWTAMWMIEDGRYKGHWAMMPREHLSFVWTPDCDLSI